MELWWGYGDQAAPHVHTLEDEAFYILDGELTLTVPHKVSTPARKGEFVWVPRNMPHYYQVTGTEKETGYKGAHVLVFEIPGGSLMTFFRAVAAGWGADIDDPEKMQEMGEWAIEKFGLYFYPHGHDFSEPEW